MSPHIFPLRGPQAIVITMQMIAGLKFRFLKQISYRSMKNGLCRLNRYKDCVRNVLFLTAAHFSSLCADPVSLRVTDRHALCCCGWRNSAWPSICHHTFFLFSFWYRWLKFGSDFPDKDPYLSLSGCPSEPMVRQYPLLHIVSRPVEGHLKWRMCPFLTPCLVQSICGPKGRK